jgi:hypothetical protein
VALDEVPRLVSNPYGSMVSSNATLAVTDAGASITAGLNSVFTWVGNNVDLQVTAVGSKPIQ